MPTLPNGLTELNCTHNKIILLPILPNSLESLYCSDNKLSFLPKFRDSLTYKYYSNNPVDAYIRYKCVNNLTIYHKENEIFASKLVKWYLDCRENPSFKFCRDRLNREYDALMEDDTGGIMN